MSTGHESTARVRVARDVRGRMPGLELFFDLVFVLCVGRLADVLADHPSWPTVSTVVLLFVPVWWAWTGVTFALDRFPDTDHVMTVLVLLAAAAAGVMAIGIPSVPGQGGTWFALGYLVVRLVLVVVYLRARSATTRLPEFYALGFGAVAAVWTLSIFLPARVQPWVWTVAIAVDVAIPAVADRRRHMLPVDHRHLPDRFGDFTIIVLGESAVSAAAAVELPLTPAVVLCLAEGFALSALLWWGFFDRGAWTRRYRALAGDDGGRVAYVVCAYLHFPLVVAITFVGSAVLLAVEHADEPVSTGTATLAAGGIALYLLTLNAMTGVLRIPKASSLVRWRFGLIAVLGVLLLAGRTLPTPAFLAGCAVVLLAHALLNINRQNRRPVHPSAAVTE